MKKTQRIFWNDYYRRHGEAWRGTAKAGAELGGKRVLELGCGTGKSLKAILAKKPERAVAVDFSEIAVRIARQRFSNGAEILHADCKKLPFENETFDIIFCRHVLGAMTLKERKKCVAEMKRVLAEGGSLLFEDFALGDLREKGAEIEKNTFQKKNGIVQHFFTKKEVEELFSGFKKVFAEKIKKKLRFGKKKVLRAEIVATAER